MEYLPAKRFCSKEQLSNLQKLLDFLKFNTEGKTDFDMLTYARKVPKVKEHYLDTNELKPDQVKNECGTVCCLAGHGPLAGIKPLEGEIWSNYVRRVFTGGNEGVFTFLFDSEWWHSMPTKEEAIFRLELFLKKGLPEGFNRYSIFNCDYFVEEYELGVHSIN